MDLLPGGSNPDACRSEEASWNWCSTEAIYSSGVGSMKSALLAAMFVVDTADSGSIPAIFATLTVMSFKNNALKVFLEISTGWWYPSCKSWATMPSMGLFCLSCKVLVDGFLIVTLIVPSCSME